MQKHDIRSRRDIEVLVQAFYRKVRQHPSIGPFFNETIKDWDEHIEKLTGFWETNLLGVRAYHGNPLKIHISVDQNFSNGLEQAHFGNWLQLWFNTVDALYAGKNALKAKENARKIAHIMFIRLFEARKS
ncbi:MAG: group III truncated hemoglobin [Cytophagales bacterium]|nr:group III truncated hemoglobin [Cytophagales bacterium]